MNKSSTEFKVILERYHMLDPEKYIIRGILLKNKMEEPEFKIYLNKQSVTFEQKMKRGLEVANKYSDRSGLSDTEYIFVCKFPQSVKKGDFISIYEIENHEKKLVQKYSVKPRTDKNCMPYHIDTVIREKDKVQITGWVLSDKVSWVLKDNKNQKLEYNIKYGYRRDVAEEFFELPPDQVMGFQIEADVPEGLHIKMMMKMNGNVYVKKLRIHPGGKLASEKIPDSVKQRILLVRKGISHIRRFGVRSALVKVCQRSWQNSDYTKWREKHIPTKQQLKKQQNTSFSYRPKISLVVPLYKTPEHYLNELIDSVKKQTYSNWELCLSDGSGKDSPLLQILHTLEESDKRIKVVYHDEQLRISENTNQAIQIATGEFVGFADHDDLLAPDALFECVKALNENRGIQAIYTDEDKVDMKGKKYFQPHFKPDFNKDLLNSTNYFCHFFMVQKTIIDQVGMLNPEFDGAQDYDFVLRCTEVTSHIHHIPKVLYHWRAHLDSTAENPESKMYAFEAGAKAIEAHYDRIGLENTKVTQTECLGIYRTHYELKEHPLVSIIIPNKDHIEDLKVCLNSISKSSYDNYEIIIVENNSTEKKTFEFYNRMKSERISVVYWEDIFNYSAINNFGVEYAKGEYLLFLNNDTEMMHPDCIKEMLGFCMREDVGVVGARLYYADQSIQHAGVVIGLGGIAGHIFGETPKGQVGYFARIITQQDFSAVTAACMMVERSVFEEVGGFDPKLQVAFNDVDFCLKVRKTGKLVVYNPYAELYHYESKSRGMDDTREKAKRFNNEIGLFEKRWEDILREGDPYFNINFSRYKRDCSLAN